MIYIITGAKNEGKTKTQQLLISILRNKLGNIQQFGETKIDIDGFICKKFFLLQSLPLKVEYNDNNQEPNNHHIGYDLVRVSDQRAVPFIRLIEYANSNSVKDFSYGPFIFFKKGIDAGKQILRECYVNRTKNVIIDEIGKLEVNGKIFTEEVHQLIKYSDNINLFISVRTEFLESVLEKFGIKNYIRIHAGFSEKEIKEVLKDIS